MRTVTGLALSIALSACATDNVETSDGYYKLDIVDNVAAERFEIELTAHVQLCLTPANWPDQQGQVDVGTGRFSVLVNHQEFSMVGRNTGYCPGCEVRVRTGESVTSFIPYAEFSLPDSIAGSSKTLNFAPSVYRC